MATTGQAIKRALQKLDTEQQVQLVMDNPKDWHIVRQEISKVILQNFKGRAVPYKPTGPKPSDYKFGKGFYYGNQKLPTPPVQIRGIQKCRTEEQKAILITKSPTHPDVMVELLQHHCPKLFGGAEVKQK